MNRLFFSLVICFFASLFVLLLEDLLPYLEMALEFALNPVAQIIALLVSLNVIAFRGFQKMDTNQLLKKVLEQLILSNKKLYDIEQALNPTVRANVVEMYLIKDGVRKKVENMLGKIGEQYDLECVPMYDDGAGNLIPAKIDGVPAWSLTDEALGKIEVDPANAFKARLTLLAEGSFLAQAKCDADRGEGERIIVGEVAFEVAGPEASVVAMSVTKVEPQA